MTPVNEVSPEALEKAVEQMTQTLNSGIAAYNAPRHPDEIDIVKEVREEFVKYGFADKLPEVFDNSRFIQEAQGKMSHAQIYNLNRWMNLQFCASDTDTSVERYSLIYDIKPSEWLTIAKQRIIPNMITLGLPVKV